MQKNSTKPKIFSFYRQQLQNQPSHLLLVLIFLFLLLLIFAKITYIVHLTYFQLSFPPFILFGIVKKKEHAPIYLGKTVRQLLAEVMRVNNISNHFYYCYWCLDGLMTWMSELINEWHELNFSGKWKIICELNCDKNLSY